MKLNRRKLAELRAARREIDDQWRGRSLFADGPWCVVRLPRCQGYFVARRGRRGLLVPRSDTFPLLTLAYRELKKKQLCERQSDLVNEHYRQQHEARNG